jgi:hypothetical protein
MKENRSSEWLNLQAEAVNHSLDRLLSVWGVDKPLAELNKFEKKQLGFVIDTVLAAYGLNIEQPLLQELISGFYLQLEEDFRAGLTDNHNLKKLSIFVKNTSKFVNFPQDILMFAVPPQNKWKYFIKNLKSVIGG